MPGKQQISEGRVISRGDAIAIRFPAAEGLVKKWSDPIAEYAHKAKESLTTRLGESQFPVEPGGWHCLPSFDVPSQLRASDNPRDGLPEPWKTLKAHMVKRFLQQNPDREYGATVVAIRQHPEGTRYVLCHCRDFDQWLKEHFTLYADLVRFLSSGLGIPFESGPDDIRRLTDLGVTAENAEPLAMVFPRGQYVLPYLVVLKLLGQATHSIEIYDNYVDHNILEMLSTIPAKVKVQIFTDKVPPVPFEPILQRLRLEKRDIKVYRSKEVHDRFIHVDDKWWDMGPSLKDVGRRTGMILEVAPEVARAKLEQILGGLPESATEIFTGEKKQTTTSVPIEKDLLVHPFKNFKLLKWATYRFKTKPFHDLDMLFVLHFLTDLVPFAQACIELGLSPKRGKFYYKNYQYPHRDPIGTWLEDKGFKVSPIEPISRAVKILEHDWRQKSARDVLIVEDGGYFAPTLHAKESPLLKFVLGAVEQTTNGLNRLKEWGERLDPSPNLDKVMQFPLLSVPDSKIKLNIEPALIGNQVVQCIQQMTNVLPLQGMEVGLFGLGTIGMETYASLRSLGANVTGWDPNIGRRLQFNIKGGKLAESSIAAVHNKKLIIGCSGNPKKFSLGADELARLEHNTYLASASSEQYEIDMQWLEQHSEEQKRFGFRDEAVSDGRLWAGTKYTLSEGKTVNVLADGYPVTFWGFGGMPHKGGDLIMTVILLAAAELASHNRPDSYSEEEPYRNSIRRTEVDEIANTHSVLEEYLREYHPHA